MNLTIEEFRERYNFPADEFSDEQIRDIMTDWQRFVNFILDIAERDSDLEKRN